MTTEKVIEAIRDAIVDLINRQGLSASYKLGALVGRLKSGEESGAVVEDGGVATASRTWPESH